MNIYHMYPVLDNPLYYGLSLSPDSRRLVTLPSDWSRHRLTWEPKRLSDTWKCLEVTGDVRLFNDYPCINLSYSAFSQRAVDTLGPVLSENGELLPVRHKLGMYYYFNCTRMVNAVDVANSANDVHGRPDIREIRFYADNLSEDLDIFLDRSLPVELLCTQRFVDRIHAIGLQGFLFIPVWPLPPGVTYHGERYRLCKLAEKWKPNEMTSLEIKGNTVVLRLRCQRKRVTKAEIAAAEVVYQHLNDALYDPTQTSAESFFGDVEGTDIVDHEIRVFLSTPDCDRLLRHLKPQLKTLPWQGQVYIVKRRGEFVDELAEEEYVALENIPD